MTSERTRSVLIVEDDAIVALDLEQALTGLGYRIAGPSVSGEDAIELARRERPDLLLMDVDLPGAIDGIEAARQIRAACDVPVIFLTGHSDSRTLARAMAAEPFGYLLKPFQAKDLKCAIEVAVHKHRRELALRRRSERLARQSLSDELTGVANRRGFFALAEQMVRIAQRDGDRLCLFFADLDGLKEINDVHGHAVGDEALQQAAAVLRRTFRDSDVIGRVGGDEFVVLARLACEDDAATLQRRLSERLAELNDLHALPFELAMSLGAVTADGSDAEALDTLVARADAAMYGEKKKRRDAARRSGVQGSRKTSH
ncbi:MAG TPA: diguanylate cyclase [Steroidobacteraceae bacterium]|nr:diguanylate cyclase [Steroidobacteraceae bacterium]